ncbi:hypothetical protein BD414DRAFT_445578, partial [Trametes punicea]
MPSPSCVYNVPMALDLDLTRTAGLEPLLAMARNKEHIQEARQFTLGPMPVSTFIDSFLPTPSDKRVDQLSPKDAFHAVPERAEDVARIFEPLASALSKRTKHKSRCPGFIFETTFYHSMRPSRLGYSKPHICCFKPENVVHVRQGHPGSRLEFGYAELFIQTSSESDLDFFIDPDVDADADALAAHEFIRQFEYIDDGHDEERYAEIQDRYKAIDRAFGLHISFATEIFARQQRLFLFTVSLAGSHARLYRWDRSGCIVTRAFDIRKHPDLLGEFFWRFSKLSDADRGHDLTVRMASPSEELLFREIVREHVALQLELEGEELDKAIRAHYQPGHVTAVVIHSQQSGLVNDQTFIFSRPVVSPLSLDGRCTRGYWAVNAATERIAFLKDTWRTISRTDVEGDVLQYLNELGIRNVPSLAIHGDVLDPSGDSGPRYQDTQTDRFRKEPWKCAIGGKSVSVCKRRHYRLITHTVGYSLKTVRGTEELLYSTYDVFQAMREALAKDSRIHRDLSVGNIILVKEPDRRARKGYLIDWDASDRVDEKGESVHAGRTGTWAFLSIRLLRPGQHNAKHTFKDDMEALIYVVFYCALFYLPHDFLPEDLTTVNKWFFNDIEELGGSTCGGRGKIMNASSRRYTDQIRFGSAAFQEWLNTVLDYFRPVTLPSSEPSAMWEPELVDAYWSRFLETHTLESSDRTVH